MGKDFWLKNAELNKGVDGSPLLPLHKDKGGDSVCWKKRRRKKQEGRG